MTKIPLTTSQYYALQVLVFLAAMVGTIAVLIVIAALFG
jgi:hypothetical protein